MIRILTLLLAGLLTACDAVQYRALEMYMAVAGHVGVDEAAEVVHSDAQDFTLRAVADGLEFPWGMAFLPDGRALITEKPGRLRLVDLNTGNSEQVAGVPPVYYRGQGGLLDVAVHPQFAVNRWVYLSYSTEVGKKRFTTRVQRFRLAADSLSLGEPLLIFEAEPAADTDIHFGCALLFDNAGYLFITMGERKQRHLAQDLGTTLGKVLRVHDDGRVPADNPFVDTPGALPQIYSYGHRNPQGIAIDRASGRLWNAEHGPQGGDEINLLRPGANYGWPVITYGEEYGGGKIGEGTHKPGMEQPLYYYLPSIGTGGLAYYDGDALPGWRGSLFVTGMRAFALSRVSLTEPVREERLLAGRSFRLRGVEQGPDGLLYLLTDNGELLQLGPADG